MKMKKTLMGILTVAALSVGMMGCSSASSNTSSTPSVEPSVATESVAPESSAPEATKTAQSGIERIKAAGVLKVATGNYVPFEFRDTTSGEIVGYDIDVAQMIADELGVTLEVQDMDFTSIIPSVQNGQYDLAIAAMYDTPARREVVEMSDSYMETGMVLVTMADNDTYKSLADLNGKRVGVKTGATSEKVAQEAKDENGYTYEIVGYTETTDCITDLMNGRVDVVVNDLLNQLEFNKVNKNVKIVGEPFTSSNLSAAVAKGDLELLEVVNKVISDMQTNGKADELYNKWIVGE